MKTKRRIFLYGSERRNLPDAFPGQRRSGELAYTDVSDLTRRAFRFESGGSPGAFPIRSAPDGAIPDRFHEHLESVFPGVEAGAFHPPPTPDPDSSFNRVRADFEGPIYRHRFDDIAAELEKADRVRKVTYEPARGVPIGVLRMVRETLGRDVPESLLRLYFAMNGIRLWWSSENPDGDDEIEGGINLLPLEEVFGGPEPIKKPIWNDTVFEGILWSSDHEPDVQKRMRSVRLLNPVEGASVGVVLRFDPNRPKPELLLRDKLDLYPLTVDFAGYVDAILESRGTIYGHFCLTDVRHFRELSRSPDFHRKVHALFPSQT